jgi:phosphohistidine phosphatase
VIFLVHHADAVPPTVDAQRPLSPYGWRAAEQLAASAAARGVLPATIWHSGKLRAKQTAEIFWRACNPLAELTAVRGLQPGDPAEWMRDRLLGETRDVMVVGHMPHLPSLLELMRGGGAQAASSFPLHGMVALDLDGVRWVEAWRMESAL